jgi:putative Holliday junction resolvase
MDGSDTGAVEGRILAIDYGRRRVGLALSDPTGTIATGLDTLVVKSPEEAIRRIAAAREEWEFISIVVGLPLRATGEQSEMANEVLDFVDSLRAACPVPVETLDERFSSIEAERMLHETGRRIKGNKGTIDQFSAEVLLRQYLDMNPRQRAYDGDEEDSDYGG